MSNPWRQYHAVCCITTLQYTLWTREVEWQWDFLQRFNNLLLLYDSMIRDKLSFLTLIGLQVQSAFDKRVEEYRATYEAHVARLEVSPPTHSSSLHHRTFIHYGTDVLSHIHITIVYNLHCDSNNWNSWVIKLQKLWHEWERLNLSSSANCCPPHCEQTQCPSHTVFCNPQHSVQKALQPFEQCFLERLVSM